MPIKDTGTWAGAKAPWFRLCLSGSNPKKTTLSSIYIVGIETVRVIVVRKRPK